MKKRTSETNWIPFWGDKWLFGSMRIEFDVAERGVWWDLMALAMKDDGFIRANEDIPYPPQQLAGMLLIDENFLMNTIKKFVKAGKLTQAKSGTLLITNWEKYRFTDRHKSRFEKAESEWDDSIRPTYRINDQIRSAVCNALKKERDGGIWEELLGYTRKELVKHLGLLFQKGMNWENYGEWHIDHIKPLAKSKYRRFSEVEEIRKFWNMNNLRPLWAEDNLRRPRINPPERDNMSQNRDPRLDKNREDKNRKEKIKEILAYFNEKTGKNFKTDPQNFISGRLNDGFTVKDCKKVIDIKTSQWLNDSKMSAYLRPSTLFRPSNFEGYLNEKGPINWKEKRDKQSKKIEEAEDGS